MKKQVLMLSAAVAALVASPAFADDWTDITTALNVPVNTAEALNGTPHNILLEDSGSISISSAGAAVTINSDNSFKAEAGSTIKNSGASEAVGILVDLTTQNRDSVTQCAGVDDCFTGITMAGGITLDGAGDTKRGIWLQGPDDDSAVGPYHFIGDIDMTSGTITITGDSSVGVLIDSLADLDGDLTIGSITMNPSSSTSTAGIKGVLINGTVNGDIHDTVSITVNGNTGAVDNSLMGMDIEGTVNGDVVIDESAAILVTGSGAQGIVLRGDLNKCDTAVKADCTGTGALVNNGTIQTRVATSTNKTGNPVAGSALAIGGSIAGGIYNAGAAEDGTGDTVLGTIMSVGSLPAVHISPALESTSPRVPIDIGIYQGDVIDPGFSFYNRGQITTLSSNFNAITQAVSIGGGTEQSKVTLEGGFYNSGSIQTAAFSQDGGNVVTATALVIGDYAVIGASDTYTFDPLTGEAEYCHCTNKINTDPLHDDWASIVNSASVGGGTISATVSGTEGGEADAISISTLATVPSLINTGTISALATTTDTSNTELNARAIWDQSGTLTYIQNNGTISAAATVLDEDGGQIIRAIDLHNTEEGSIAGTNGVLILNQATTEGSASIIGDIVFGTGVKQVVRVEGVSTDHVATIQGDIFYGGGKDAGSDRLIIGNFGTVTGEVTADATLGVTVDVQNGGTLNLQNASEALTAYDFHVRTGGTLNLTVLQEFRSGIINAIDKDAGGGVLFDTGADLNITYGSFVPSDSIFVLISAPHLDDHFGSLTITDIDRYNAQLSDHRPFLFETTLLSRRTTADDTTDQLVLEVTPKDAAELGLSGYAAQILPFANAALSQDDTLGAAFVAGITDEATAQKAYNQLAPDVTGGARAIAVALTDQSSGPVATRQRTLRMYGKESGDVTLWGQEFAEFVQDPGHKSTGQTGFKDHGFGFVLGLDGGDPKSGWYGGAFSFYSGDIVEPLPRNSHTNTLWYMLTGYTDWRGRGLFLDTKLDVGYMTLKSKRYLDLRLPDPSGTGTVPFLDEADSKRPGLVGAVGFTTGAILNYGSTTFTPQVSVDGMTMRQEGYTETHPVTSPGNGKGMLLQTQSYYASSARIFLGTEIREDLNMGDFFVQPDLRLGYRYDFLNDATKLKVNFADVGNASTPTPGQIFAIVGPDPAQGNFVAGASISATTDAWTLGANFDFVRGTNGATTEIGTIHLLGRI